ncbi:hypothetical protein FB45DRAFT_920488 [Roridomyces roridus]|uniref:Uncharacterized protein n=1 Tax=Roridomyces roridus TaxID=1738132 RepID=A0AAD7BPN4_9AGAR|nr:hypothetical protein FB45DRAFT_920488 [Roridomyces roridus]
MLPAKLFLPLAFIGLAGASPQTPISSGTGDVLYFTPGYGACGWRNTSDQAVGSVSLTTYESWPGNSICGKNLTITDPANNETVWVIIADNFVEDDQAGPHDVQVPKKVFQKMAPVTAGVIPNANWSIS